MTLSVIKIGGNVIDNDKELENFLIDFAAVPGPKILVHGGGKLATKLAREMGIETVMIEGRRVTSKAMLDIAVMVYAGLINKRIVSKLQSLACNALGLSGADGKCITSHRRPIKNIDYGEVGDVDCVNTETFLALIKEGFTPIVCAITADTQGNLLNTNADTVATEIAKAISCDTATRLIYCFEKNGVLVDMNDPENVIPSITPCNYISLKASGIISDGMIPKIENALDAISSSPLRQVIIKNSRRLNDTSGTYISNED